jgi:hypothetical protein
VERSHGPGQYRLVKELCLAGISTVEHAGRFLLETCLPKMNGKFSRPAADSTDARVPLGTAELKDIPCFEYGRAVTNDYAVRFECVPFQILKTGKTLPRPKDRGIVRIGLDEKVSILWKGKPLPVAELPIPEKSRPASHAA